jgi:small subunit ribosomal protein S8
MMTDPIADMLTRIRNASGAHHEQVEMPTSHVKEAIAHILQTEGFIRRYERTSHEGHPYLRLHLKYGPNKSRVVQGLRRISHPGLRVYAGKDEVPKVLGGLGVAIVSTSRGIVTDQEARRLGLGGEILAYIW